MSLREWLNKDQPPTVPPPVPRDEPMSRDRPPADYDDDAGRPLTHTRVDLPGTPGEEARVVTVARDGLAREVLVGRAVPLLARARRVLDEIADPTAGAPAPAWARERAEVIADAIADLIGHSTTDGPPAPELEAVLAEGVPARLTWEQIATLPRDVILPRSALPLEPAVPARPAETAEEKSRRHEKINEGLEALGITVIPPCPMAPYAEPEQPTPHVCQMCEVPLATHGPPCSPESREPAPPVRDEGVDARELPAHNLTMPHQICRPGMSDADLIDWERGVEGCPPGCPRRLAAEHRCPDCRGLLADKPALGCQYTGAHRVARRLDLGQEEARRVGRDVARERQRIRDLGKGLLPESREPATPVEDRFPQAGEVADPLSRAPWTPAESAALAGIHEPDPHALMLFAYRLGWHHGARVLPGSREPAAPVGENPAARARRLDAHARTVSAMHRRALQDADEAWRAIGGRP